MRWSYGIPVCVREQDLYPHVKNYLDSLGYTVRGEVGHCDLLAVRDDECIAVELKKHLNIKLVEQAVERQEFADSVYIAVPVQGSSLPKNIRAAQKLLRRLSIGVLLVRYLKHRTRVELFLHPEDSLPRRKAKKRQAVLREFHARTGDFSSGGIRGKHVSAYREEAVYLAHLLFLHGTVSPAFCREHGGSEKSAAILRKNYYGWFERVSRGRYRLHQAGSEALDEYRELLDEILSRKAEA